MVRVFNSYVPVRTLILLGGEIATVCASFAMGVLIQFRENSGFVLADEYGVWKILTITALALLCSHFMDPDDIQWLVTPGEMYPRTLMLVGALSFLLAGVTFAFPSFQVGHSVFLIGLCILAPAWILWRWAYGRLIFLPAFRERVYLVGDGVLAKRIMEAIRTRAELGMDIVGWSGEHNNGNSSREFLGKELKELGKRSAVDRVIIALANRRSTMPVNELLELRLNGVRVDEGTSLLEKMSCKIEVDDLYPSWMIFGEGFRLGRWPWYFRRLVSVLLALVLSILALPVIPIIAILIWLTSPGPILYKQKRVGLRGEVFDCYKFRTMRRDAEADSGPTWASDDDPRITKVGKFLRRTRLDEIPQLWNVLRGDMAFVGPRPERPEFVKKLSQEIPYYPLRHMARPGITGWAQINYGYGSSVEEAKEKLRYDLYYLRNTSVALDLLIVFRTMRAVVVGRGVR